MTVEEIKRHRDDAPFRPFMLCMDDGSAHLVPHPDHLFIPPTGTTVGLWTDHIRIIDSEHVSVIRFDLPPPPKKPTGPSKKPSTPPR